MARTAITVTKVNSFATASAVTFTAGEADDHTIDATKCPKLLLLAQNTNGGSAIAFSLELTAGSSSYGQTPSLDYSVPASSSEVILLDVPPDLFQSGSVLHIDSADGNIADMNFAAFTW